MTKEKVAAMCLRLSAEDRADLAAALYLSLEEKTDPDCELAWYKEAERRYTIYRQGKMKASSAAAVLKRAKARLR